MGRLIAGLALSLPLVAVAGDLRRVQNPDCDPGFLALNPDAGSYYTVGVVALKHGRPVWTREYQRPAPARCAETKAALEDVLGQVPLAPGWDVRVGTCR